MGYPIKKGQVAQPLVFLMIDSADHVTGKAGLTPTVTLSKNGGDFGAPAGLVTEIGNGWYKVAGNAVDSDTLGPLVLHATAAGADPVDDRFDVVAYDPQSATNLGLSFLSGDAYAIVADPDFGNAQLVRSKVPANSLSIAADNTAYVNVLKWLSVTPPAPTTPGVPTVALAVTPPTAVQVRAEIDANSTQLAALATRLTAARALLLDNLDAAVSSRSTFDGSSVGTVADKAGYSLAATGLDAIPVTPPAGVAATFREMVVQLWRRKLKKSALVKTGTGTGNLVTYADDGATVLTSQPVTDDGTTQTVGAAT